MEAPDEHLIMFETERHRVWTDDEKVAGVLGGAGGFIVGCAADIYLIEQARSEEGGQAPDPSPAPLRLSGAAGGRPVASHVSVHPEISAISNQAGLSLLPAEQQAGTVLGLTGLAAIAAVAITGAIRLRRYKRKVNFKSSLSPEALEKWYRKDSAPVDP